MHGEMHKLAVSEEDGHFPFSKPGWNGEDNRSWSQNEPQDHRGPDSGEMCRSGWLRLHTPDLNKGYSGIMQCQKL